MKAHRYKFVYDISVLLDEFTVGPVPDLPGFVREVVAKLELSGGAVAELSTLEMVAHVGTHIDCPSHFFPKGKRIDDYGVEDFIMPAVVVKVSDRKAVRLCHIEGQTIRPGDALLLRTENSENGLCRGGEPGSDRVFVTPEVAEFCVERQIRLLGIDCDAPERPGEPVERAPIHRILLGNDILILEGIDLADVPPGRYTLFCLPLKIKGGEGSPVRAVLVT